MSHLKGKQDYGHQAVAVMLSCNGIVLNYAIVMYDKSKSKVKIVQEIADELPVPPVVSYFLCDSWYTCGDIMDAFIKNLRWDWWKYASSIGCRARDEGFVLDEMVSSTMQNTGFPDRWASL